MEKIDQYEMYLFFLVKDDINHELYKENKEYINIIVNKINNINKYVENLWEDCILDHCENLPNPTLWLINEEYMRKKWLEYKKNINYNIVDEELKENMKESNFYKYMENMCILYPYGYGKYIKNYSNK